MVNGTSRMRASVCASSVLPTPVGPRSRMLDLSSSTSSSRASAGVDALVVVVDRHRQRLLGLLLPDHVLVERRLDLLRRRDLRDRLRDLALLVLGEDLVAEGDALVADVDRRAGDELPDRVLGLSAERAAQVFVVGHGDREKGRRARGAGAEPWGLGDDTTPPVGSGSSQAGTIRCRRGTLVKTFTSAPSRPGARRRARLKSSSPSRTDHHGR
jgi:hypothetical protein